MDTNQFPNPNQIKWRRPSWSPSDRGAYLLGEAHQLHFEVTILNGEKTTFELSARNTDTQGTFTTASDPQPSTVWLEDAKTWATARLQQWFSGKPG